MHDRESSPAETSVLTTMLRHYTMSPFCILFQLRVMAVVVTTVAIRHAKLQSNRFNQQTSVQLFTGRMPFLSPNHQCQSTEGRCFNAVHCDIFSSRRTRLLQAILNSVSQKIPLIVSGSRFSLSVLTAIFQVDLG